MAPTTDPFYLVKDDIQASLDKAQTKFLQWQSAARKGPERGKLEADVEGECRNIAWQVDEMEKAVDVAESNMTRFGLTAQEVASRRKWVAKTRRQCESISAGLKAPAPQTSRRDELADGSAASKFGAAVRAENDTHISSEQEKQQLLIRQQDEDLDYLGEHVVRVGNMGRQIGEELAQQGDLLDELDTDIDTTTNRLGAAQKKMAHVLKKAGLRGQLAIICVLLVLLVVLVLVAFS